MAHKPPFYRRDSRPGGHKRSAPREVCPLVLARLQSRHMHGDQGRRHDHACAVPLFFRGQHASHHRPLMWFSCRGSSAWLKLAFLVVALTHIMRPSVAAFISPCTLDAAYERVIEEACDTAGKVRFATSRRLHTPSKSFHKVFPRDLSIRRRTVNFYL